MDRVAVRIQAAVDFYVLAFVLLGFGLVIQLVSHVRGRIVQDKAITVFRDVASEYLRGLLHLALCACRAGLWIGRRGAWRLRGRARARRLRWLLGCSVLGKGCDS